jgi:hypothetical protein
VLEADHAVAPTGCRGGAAERVVRLGGRASSGGGGVNATGASAHRIPIAGSTGSVGHVSGKSEGFSALASWTPTAITVAAAIAPEHAVLHSGNRHGSGRYCVR